MPKSNRAHQLMEKAILALPRRRLRDTTKKKLAASVYALERISETRKKLDKYGVANVLCVYDAAQFCLMFDADLTVLTRDLSCSSDWWESRLYGRLLAMTMIECTRHSDYPWQTIPQSSASRHPRRFSEPTHIDNKQKLVGIPQAQ